VGDWRIGALEREVASPRGAIELWEWKVASSRWRGATQVHESKHMLLQEEHFIVNTTDFFETRWIVGSMCLLHKRSLKPPMFNEFKTIDVR
jgi:hypothetical protein